MEPQLFHSVDSEETLLALAEQDDIAFEQKVDGMRMLTRLTNSGVEFLTRGGRPLKSTAAMKHFDAISETFQFYVDLMHSNSEVYIDGEILTDVGVYVAFDMPSYTAFGINTVTTKTPNYERFQQLSNTVNSLMSDNLKVVRRSTTTDGKKGLLEEIYKAGGEGVIVKDINSSYDAGARVKHSLKYKFTETADVVVLAKNSGESRHSKRGGDKINYELGVIPSDKELIDVKWEDVIHVGNCSGIGKDAAEVGDVVEVKYLYRGAGGKLVQPTMVRRREDKNWDECSESQLRNGVKMIL